MIAQTMALFEHGNKGARPLYIRYTLSETVMDTACEAAAWITDASGKADLYTYMGRITYTRRENAMERHKVSNRGARK